MKKYNFEKFKNICEKCNYEFITYSISAHEYDLIFASTIENELIVFNPDENSIWGEVEFLIKNIINDNKLALSQEDELFEDAFNLTLDLSPTNNKYYLWGKTPCSNCNGFERSYFGPLEPTEFVELSVYKIEQKNWIALNEENKIKILTDLAIT